MSAVANPNDLFDQGQLYTKMFRTPEKKFEEKIVAKVNFYFFLLLFFLSEI